MDRSTSINNVCNAQKHNRLFSIHIPSCCLIAAIVQSEVMAFVSKLIHRSSMLLFALLCYHRASAQCGSITIYQGDFKFIGRSCGLTGFPDGVPWNITWVDVSDNSIENLTTPSGFPNLVRFIAERNLMTAFPNLTSFKDTLERLFLSGNKMSYIDPHLLAPLVKLYSLSINNNLLTTIPDVAGPILTGLSLTGNLLNEIPTMSNIGRLLTSINLNDNQIANISGDITFPNLQTLWLIDNQVERINITGNSMLPMIQHLMVDNKLSEFPDLHWIADTLTTLDLNSNVIHNAPQSIMKDFAQLDRLVIHNNLLTEFPDLTSVGDTITFLKLSANKITYIPQHLVDVLSVIRTLYISGNLLTTFPALGQIRDSLANLYIYGNPYHDPAAVVDSIFDTMASPQLHIDFRAMAITNAPSSLCEGKTFLSIQIKQTTLICDCRLRWLKVATLSGLGIGIKPNSKPCIGGPAELQSVPWVNITLSRLQCNGKYYFIIYFKHNFIIVH